MKKCVIMNRRFHHSLNGHSCHFLLVYSEPSLCPPTVVGWSQGAARGTACSPCSCNILQHNSGNRNVSHNFSIFFQFYHPFISRSHLLLYSSPPYIFLSHSCHHTSLTASIISFLPHSPPYFTPHHFFTHPSLPLFRPLCRVYRSQLAVSADHANSPHLPLFYPPPHPPSQVAFAALTQSSMLIVYWLEQLRRRQEQGGSDCRSNGDCLDWGWFEGHPQEYTDTQTQTHTHLGAHERTLSESVSVEHQSLFATVAGHTGKRFTL